MMEYDMSSLLLGTLAGGIVASLIWVIARAVINGQKSRAVCRRNELISSIGNILVEIDTVVIEKRSGSIDHEVFKCSLTDKINGINRIFKPNLHKFEVYYVKFIDALIDRYTDLLHSGIQTFHYDNREEFEAAYQDKKPERVTVQVSKSIEQDSNNAGIPDLPYLPEKEPIFEENNEITESVSIEPVLEKTGEQTKKIEIVKPLDELNAREISGITDGLAGTGNQFVKVKPVDDADVPQIEPDSVAGVDNGDLEHESEEIAAASIPKDQTSDISFEEMARDVLSSEEDEKEEELPIGLAPIDSSINPPIFPQQSVESSEDEDFTMETIMDLDMNKMPAFVSDISKITIKQSPSKETTTEPDTKPEDTKDNEKQDADEIVFEQKPSGSINQKKPSPSSDSGSENETITGDDVVNKIESFFRIVN